MKKMMVLGLSVISIVLEALENGVVMMFAPSATQRIRAIFSYFVFFR